MNKETNNKDAASSAADYFEVRLNKINEIREMGINPFPDRFERTHTLEKAISLDDDTKDVSLAGRLITKRVMGKLSFCHIFDWTGKLQIAFTTSVLEKEQYNFFKKYIDTGDFIGVSGTMFTTHKGEKTLNVEKFVLLSKALRGLPEKWHGVTDQETIYRQRYLDIIMNSESRDRFKLRTKTIKVIRRFLEDHEFDEVETPVLQTKPSGALATPFSTHHNALDIDVYLRIAPETYLKRCIIGGYDKVFEFARSFRNEGMDPSHLQDFTMLEYYCAYWNYEDNIRFTQKLIQHTIKELMGDLKIKIGEHTIDFAGDYPVKSFHDLFKEKIDLDLKECDTKDKLVKEIKKRKIDIEDIDKIGYGKLVDQLYKKTCRPDIINPLFLTGHPIELSPLARRNDDDPGITDRFQLVVMGWEIVNAYSELVDPIDQRNRLETQASLRQAGDDEAMVLDEDYLLAMEHGMPPISGWGMGIDRFVALIADAKNLRDVVLFPLMRPLSDD